MTEIVLSLSHARCCTQNDGTNFRMAFELTLIDYEIISAVNKIEMSMRVFVCVRGHMCKSEYVLCVKWQPMSSVLTAWRHLPSRRNCTFTFSDAPICMLESRVQQHIKYSWVFTQYTVHINHAITGVTATYALVYPSEMYQKMKMEKKMQIQKHIWLMCHSLIVGVFILSIWIWRGKHSNKTGEFSQNSCLKNKTTHTKNAKN